MSASAHALPSFPQDLHAVVQGGTRGLGLAFVEALLRRPGQGRVHATGRRATASPELARLREVHGDRLVPVDLDLLDEPGLHRATARIREDAPRLHLLLNVSGVLHDDRRGMAPEKKLEQLRATHALHAFAINALGPTLVTAGLAESFRHGERAAIANLSARVGSIGDNGLGGWYSYRATKAAQNQFTRTTAIELRRRSPETVVVALHPGTVDTDLSAPFQRGVKPEKLFTPERAARQLLDVLDGLTPADSGGFFAWDGAPIPW
ncbi:MAG: SDR family NAD(P)-dependent oxidoreductase [Deltaproteobacteria bacterium]|nr:MAG: SDR family NAD(P)-dependent oxidoreductase [Deltaproteobacteria bacterium]